MQPGEVPLHQMRPSVRLFWGEVMQTLSVLVITLLVPYAIVSALEVVTGEVPPEEFRTEFYGPGAAGIELFYLGPRILVALIHVSFTRYTLTTDRVYSRTEFLSTDLKVIPYEKVTQIRMRRTLFERLLGITEVSVRAYGAEEGRIRMRGLVDARPAFEAARDLVRVHNTVEAIVRSD